VAAIQKLQTITVKKTKKNKKNKANSSWANNLTSNATNHCAAAVNTSFTLFNEVKLFFINLIS